MCNAYRCKEEDLADHTGGRRLLLDRKDLGRLVRRTDRAPVLRGDGMMATMRWGWERDKLGTINNSREDKLRGPMWGAAFKERRCVIPVTGFYEFTGQAGHKQAHLFTRPDDNWFWIAGLWEESEKHGLCFSMVTTEPNALVATIHDRMPAYLEEGEVARYLAGEIGTFTPLASSIRVEDATNPLLKSKPIQGELF